MNAMNAAIFETQTLQRLSRCKQIEYHLIFRNMSRHITHQSANKIDVLFILYIHVTAVNAVGKLKYFACGKISGTEKRNRRRKFRDNKIKPKISFN